MSDVRILRCPACQEFVASDATRCRFCRCTLGRQTVSAGVAAVRAENKEHRRSRYLKHMLAGSGLFAVGALITLGTLWAEPRTRWWGGFYVVNWALMAAGFGDFVYGLYGFLGEALSKAGRGAGKRIRFDGRPDS